MALFAVTANAAAAVLGRRLFRSEAVEPLDATGIAMAVGAAALLVVGTLVEPRPRLSGQAWGILGWLAVVNTAFAFWLWSRTQRRLTATESSVLNNTMLLQIALLAWLFLGEPLSGREVLGLLGVAAGAALVQWRPRRA
ncbi:MAG: DMT family transporter [Thermoanaerobaculia bacterium]